MNEKDAYRSALISLLQYPNMEAFIGSGLYATIYTLVVTNSGAETISKYKPFTVIKGGKYKEPKPCPTKD
jgi:hypothetical protein